MAWQDVPVSQSDDLIALQQRVRRLERQMEVLLKHFGIEVPPESAAPELAGVLELVRAGKLIEAIKLYRERTGAGLAEAKSAVEALRREIG